MAKKSKSKSKKIVDESIFIEECNQNEELEDSFDKKVETSDVLVVENNLETKATKKTKKQKQILNDVIKLCSLKNQLMADGTFIKKNEEVEVQLEYATRLLSLSSPSYRRV